MMSQTDLGTIQTDGAPYSLKDRARWDDESGVRICSPQKIGQLFLEEIIPKSHMPRQMIHRWSR